MRALLTVVLVGLAILSTISSGGEPEKGKDLYKDTKYVPMCFETNKQKCKPPGKNMIYLMTGNGLNPYAVDKNGQAYNPVDATFTLGYFRTVKSDLAFGFALDGCRGGLTGWKIGAGWIFGD